MSADQEFLNVGEFSEVLRVLRAKRRKRVLSARRKRVRRVALRKVDRGTVLRKTDGRCHICGGIIEEDNWQADHVLAHSAGGSRLIENYLPAHSLCNNYRWHYDSEEFQWILKLGVWLRTQIELGKPIGQTAGQKFCEYDRRRAARRKK